MRIDDGVHLCRGIEWCDPAASEHDALDAVVGGAVLSEEVRSRASVGVEEHHESVWEHSERRCQVRVVGHREWPRFATGACDVVAPHDHDYEGPCGVVLEGERIEEARQVIGVLRYGEDCEVCETGSGCPVDTQGLQTRGVVEPSQVPCCRARVPAVDEAPRPCTARELPSGIEVEGCAEGLVGLVCKACLPECDAEDRPCGGVSWVRRDGTRRQRDGCACIARFQGGC